MRRSETTAGITWALDLKAVLDHHSERKKSPNLAIPLDSKLQIPLVETKAMVISTMYRQ